MKEILQFVFRDFETFAGCFLLYVITLGVVISYFTNLTLQIIHKIIRARTIRKVGYPPVHCDGDGDRNKDYEHEEDNVHNA